MQTQHYFTWSHKHLLPYKNSQNFQQSDLVAKVGICISFFEAVCSDEVHPLVTYFIERTWFYLNSHVSTQRNTHRSAYNSRLLYDAPLHDITVAVCASSATRTTRPTFLMDTINSKTYIEKILAKFYENLSDQEREYGFFQQGGSSLETGCNSMAVLQSNCGDRIILCFVTCSFARYNPIGQLCVWGNLKDNTLK